MTRRSCVLAAALLLGASHAGARAADGSAAADARFREAGVPPERVIGLLARWSGLGDGGEVSARDLLARGFDVDRVPRADAVFTPADERRLLGAPARTSGRRRAARG